MSLPLPLSVVVVVRDGVATLDRALAAILASSLPREDYELIVVDDASSDGSPRVAARYADTVMRLTGGQSGPAYARNRGAELGRGDVVAFVDADVEVRPDTLSGMLQMLADHQGLDAIAASHTDTPAASNFASQYWNLLVHFGEAHKARAEGGLTSGCVAIRRAVLISTGMYDEWRFGPPCLETVELGTRLTKAGHGVLLSRDLQIIQLGQWSILAVCREVWNRSSLLARSLGYQRTLATTPTEVVFTLSRIAVPALAVIGTILFFTAFLMKRREPQLLGLLAAGSLAANFPVHRFFLRTRGFLFMLAVAPLHLLMQCVGGVALCTGRLMRETVGDRLPDAATQAYAEVGLETWPPIRRAK